MLMINIFLIESIMTIYKDLKNWSKPSKIPCNEFFEFPLKITPIQIWRTILSSISLFSFLLFEVFPSPSLLNSQTKPWRLLFIRVQTHGRPPRQSALGLQYLFFNLIERYHILLFSILKLILSRQGLYWLTLLSIEI